jgi:hypothetical protein
MGMEEIWMVHWDGHSMILHGGLETDGDETGVQKRG